MVLNEPEATAETLREHADGRLWLHTGDIGSMDSDGYLFFKGRQKRIIKVSGVSVYPAQVEQVLEAHPAVRRACVIGTFCICMRGTSPPSTGGRFSSRRTSLIVMPPI